jgi:hypothetical protein
LLRVFRGAAFLFPFVLRAPFAASTLARSASMRSLGAS